MIQAIIFDVDGVLLDTVSYHFKAWEKVFTEEGIFFSFEDYLQKVNGLPRTSGIKNMLLSRDGAKIKDIAERKQKYYLGMVEKNPPSPLPGVINLLQQLKQRNIILAAASSSKNAPFLLEKAKLAIFFQTIIGGNDFKKSKPDPDIFLTASKKLNKDPFSCAVVEDAALGLEAAKNANMKAIGMFTSNDLGIYSIADIVFTSFEKDSDIIKFVLNN